MGTYSIHMLLVASIASSWGGAAAGAAPPDTLTAASVAALARARAPEVLEAQARVLEARGRLTGARAYHLENPTVEGVASTSSRFERRTQWELSVPLELGWGRGRRAGVARAELERERHRATDARRLAVGAALMAFYRALHADRRLDLAGERLAVAERLRHVTAERHRAGDVARVDLHAAEIELARAASEVHAREGDLARARMELAVTLGLPTARRFALAGDLEDHGPFGDTTFVSAARPDLRAAEREVAAARSQLGLARSLFFPQLAFRLDYGHEDGAAVARPGLGVTVPLFNHGQGERGEARGRLERARLERARLEAAAGAEVEGTSAAYAAALEAASELRERGVPRAVEVASLAEESYRAGKTDLAAFLVVRRDALETQREFIDRLLEAALAGIERAVATGQWE